LILAKTTTFTCDMT